MHQGSPVQPTQGPFLYAMTPDLRQRVFYAILDTQYVPIAGWTSKCRALIKGGADLIQVRAKHQTPERCGELIDAVLPLTRAAGIPLIVNDHLDIALQHSDVGLHIGQEDASPEACRRRLGPQRILGLSTHSIDQAQSAISLGNILSYFAVGPVFATQTKPTYVPVGLELVRRVAALNPSQPFYAIGGISRCTVKKVIEAGAQRIVVVSDVLNAADTAKAVQGIKKIL